MLNSLEVDSLEGVTLELKTTLSKSINIGDKQEEHASCVILFVVIVIVVVIVVVAVFWLFIRFLCLPPVFPR